jgi:hypothetical protein
MRRRTEKNELARTYFRFTIRCAAVREPHHFGGGEETGNTGQTKGKDVAQFDLVD